MPRYIVCPKCSKQLNLDFVENSKNLTVTCDNCKAHMILSSKILKNPTRKKAEIVKKSLPSTSGAIEEYDEIHEAKNSQNNSALGFLEKCFNTGKKVFNTLNGEYSAAEGRLQRQGIDEWDEEQLEMRARCSGFFEEAIIRQRLRDLRKSNIEEND